ncbi:alkene reductase [Cryomorpha ignava]|uniref:Alkene reductase n=1 Tax=Cryomorpha ignava TaxID=101383 RepID=A0A7K3WSP8_9FLAO|nr:alkene reductase [Cryomorpha ignava]NEN24720.1 alkene reductase [Cryomorpha ignava]
MKIFEEYQLGNIALKNRIVMAPMTRSRAVDNIPNELMAEYYGQRANAGLIITEGTSPSPNGLGYPRIPGVFNKAQVEGWKKVTSAVHEKGGKIFLQIMHTGRVSHPLNMPEGAVIIAPSAVPLDGEMYTDQEGLKSYPRAKVMTPVDVKDAIKEYIAAAKNSIEAGFDGVELHGANGYLIEQFLNPGTNMRNDEYGGNIENRCRFAIEVAKGVALEIGGNKTAIRLSPYGANSGMTPKYDSVKETYVYLAQQLAKIGLVYIHLVDHSSMGNPEVPQEIKNNISRAFGGTMILSGGLNFELANEIIERGQGDLVAFARKYLANPDLVYRFKNEIELNEPILETFYTPGEKGYTDYPVATEKHQTA